MFGTNAGIMCNFKIEKQNEVVDYVLFSRVFWKHLNGDSCLQEEPDKKEKVLYHEQQSLWLNTKERRL